MARELQWCSLVSGYLRRDSNFFCFLSLRAFSLPWMLVASLQTTKPVRDDISKKQRLHIRSTCSSGTYIIVCRLYYNSYVYTQQIIQRITYSTNEFKMFSNLPKLEIVSYSLVIVQCNSIQFLFQTHNKKTGHTYISKFTLHFTMDIYIN